MHSGRWSTRPESGGYAFLPPRRPQMEGAGLIWSGFYFYFHDQKFDPERRHYSIAALAQGLGRLGAPLFSNVGVPPFIARPLRPEDGHAVIFAATEDTYN